LKKLKWKDCKPFFFFFDFYSNEVALLIRPIYLSIPGGAVGDDVLSTKKKKNKNGPDLSTLATFVRELLPSAIEGPDAFAKVVLERIRFYSIGILIHVLE